MFPIPIGTDRPQRRIPWVNLFLIAANVVIYFLSHGSSRGMHQDTSELLPSWIPWMLYAHSETIVVNGQYLQVDPNIWQYITYQFLHANLLHLGGNMLFLYVFGNNLNEKLGHLGYLAFYLTGGVLAGCGQVAAGGQTTLGASGSISAVTGLFFVLLPRTNVRIFIWFFFFLDIFEIPSMWFILFSVGKDVVESFDKDARVAHSAHLAGNAAGVAIGLLLLGTKLVQRDHYDLLAMVDRWRRRKQYENLVRQGYDPFLASRGGPPKNSPVAAVAAETAPVLDPRIPALREAASALIRDHQITAAAEKYLELRRVDPAQTLAPQDQLDVANQLMSDGRYDVAAQAYEDYLKLYQSAARSEQVQLILGLIYARYLPQPSRAIEMLRLALRRLHDINQRQMAEAELLRLGVGLDGPLPS